MHEPAACGARPAQQASVQILPAETDAIGTIEEKNPAASSSAIAIPLTRRTLGFPTDRGFIFLSAGILPLPRRRAILARKIQAL